MEADLRKARLLDRLLERSREALRMVDYARVIDRYVARVDPVPAERRPLLTLVDDDERPRGTSTLPPGLTEQELRDAPVLVSVEQLIIEDLTEEEFEAFDQAIHS